MRRLRSLRAKATQRFNQHVEMDLFSQDSAVSLHLVGLIRHFNSVGLVSGKKSSLVLERLRSMRLLRFGIPGAVSPGAGGEFFSDVYAGGSPLLGFVRTINLKDLMPSLWG